MNELDKISILVCVHSRGEMHDSLLLRGINSLTRQTYIDFEIVVVLDDCWGKTKASLLEFLVNCEFANFKIVEKENKRGHAAAKNFGLQYCSGDWVAFLDADDQYMDCKLEEQRNFLLKNKDVDFCATNTWDLLGGKIRVNCFSINDYQTHDEIKNIIYNENVICSGSVMVKKENICILGGFSELKEHRGIEDWEMWKKAMSNGFKFAKIADRLYIYSLGTSVAR